VVKVVSEIEMVAQEKIALVVTGQNGVIVSARQEESANREIVQSTKVWNASVSK
jgi:hypothetical protein